MLKLDASFFFFKFRIYVSCCISTWRQCHAAAGNRTHFLAPRRYNSRLTDDGLCKVSQIRIYQIFDKSKQDSMAVLRGLDQVPTPTCILHSITSYFSVRSMIDPYFFCNRWIVVFVLWQHVKRGRSDKKQGQGSIAKNLSNHNTH